MIFYDISCIRRTTFRIILAASGGFVAFIFIVIILGTLQKDTESRLAERASARPHKPANPKQVALTFDDGPDPVHTRSIMHLLKKEGVSATFFVIGKQVIENQAVLKEMQESGFEIGNHTFTHSPRIHSSPLRLQWELQITRRLVEYVIGYTPWLYRPPFLLDIERYSVPETQAGENIARIARDYGYITVGAGVDSRDWDGTTAGEIVERVRKQLPSPDGNAILFHDRGTNMPNAINALRILIPQLKSEGYEFVLFSTLVGLDQSTVLPPTQYTFLGKVSSRLSIGITTRLAYSLHWMLRVILLIGAARITLLLILWLFSLIRRETVERSRRLQTLTPISILIPAYNEAKNIAATVRSILGNTYRPREIIVINDCSTDNTAAVVEQVRNQYPEMVRVVGLLKNKGKANALNVGLRLARSSVAVAIDGDTILDCRALQNLARHFNDPTVAAVAGEVRIANPKTFLARYQEIEYTLGQRIEREAFSTIGIIQVIPGAIGAWRISAIFAAGGYTNDTLTEDQDLTLAILRSGKKILYDRDAIAYTEAPQTLRQFLKQRFRWTFGTMQCVWKHRGIWGDGSRWRLKLLLLPNNILYGAVLPIFYPVADIYALFFLFTGSFSTILMPYLLFTATDLAYASLALTQVRGGVRLMLFVPLQRIYYRVLFVVVIRSLVKAIEGTTAYWDKLERVGDALEEFSCITVNPAGSGAVRSADGSIPPPSAIATSATDRVSSVLSGVNLPTPREKLPAETLPEPKQVAQ